MYGAWIGIYTWSTTISRSRRCTLLVIFSFWVILSAALRYTNANNFFWFSVYFHFFLNLESMSLIYLYIGRYIFDLDLFIFILFKIWVLLPQKMIFLMEFQLKKNPKKYPFGLRILRVCVQWFFFFFLRMNSKITWIYYIETKIIVHAL